MKQLLIVISIPAVLFIIFVVYQSFSSFQRNELIKKTGFNIEGFRELNANSNCQDKSRNRLYLIDNKLVFWLVETSTCSLEHSNLYGLNVYDLKCQDIGGPLNSPTLCPGNAEYEDLFKKLINNKYKYHRGVYEGDDNLGLGTDHKVERLSL